MGHRLAFILGGAVLTALIFATAAVAQPICEVMCAPGTLATGCPTTNFQTIQSAIDNPLCTSIVLRATQEGFPYREQLTIGRNVSIAGKTVPVKEGRVVIDKIVTTLQPPADPPFGPGMFGPNLMTIVGTPAVRSRVKIKHVIFQGPGPAVGGFIGVRAGRDT